MKLNQLLKSIGLQRGTSIGDIMMMSDNPQEVNAVHRGITSLDGSPKRVGIDFLVSGNRLTSLAGGPREVGEDYNCEGNMLTDLSGAPESVGNSFLCQRNQLTSLNCERPISIGGSFVCYENELTNLKNVHKHFKKIGSIFSASNNPIESHVLGLLLIPGIKTILLDNTTVHRILNKHLGKGMAGVLAAQEELEDAGLGAFAQL